MSPFPIISTLLPVRSKKKRRGNGKEGKGGGGKTRKPPDTKELVRLLLSPSFVNTFTVLKEKEDARGKGGEKKKKKKGSPKSGAGNIPVLPSCFFLRLSRIRFARGGGHGGKRRKKITSCCFSIILKSTRPCSGGGEKGKKEKVGMDGRFSRVRLVVFLLLQGKGKGLRERGGGKRRKGVVPPR